MRIPNRLMVMTSLLVTLTLSCTLVSNLLTPGTESGAGAVTPPAIAGPLPAESPGAAAPGETTPTAEGVRRKALAPTPTAFQATGKDDVRSILDLSQPNYVDYFDDPNLWFDYDTPGRAGYKVEDGHLLGIDYEPEELYTWWSYTDRRADDVYAEVSATNGDCVGKDSVGFVIHSNPETGAGGYSLEVACDGSYRFRLMKQGGSPKDLIRWTPSPALKTGKGATNRLGIWDSRSRFHLFINGEEVGKINDPTLSWAWGNFALYVRASQTYDLTATFDDFAFWKVPYLQ